MKPTCTAVICVLVLGILFIDGYSACKFKYELVKTWTVSRRRLQSLAVGSRSITAGLAGLGTLTFVCVGKIENSSNRLYQYTVRATDLGGIFCIRLDGRHTPRGSYDVSGYFGPCNTGSQHIYLVQNVRIY